MRWAEIVLDAIDPLRKDERIQKRKEKGKASDQESWGGDRESNERADVSTPSEAAQATCSDVIPVCEKIVSEVGEVN